MIPEGLVLDARTVSPRFPGIGRYVLGLSRAWGAAASHALFFASPARDPRLPAGTTVRVEASPFDLRQQWEVPRALRACGARVYHAPYYLMPVAPGVPTVLNCWDMIPLAVPGLFPPAKRLAFRFAHTLVFRAARVIVVPTEATRADVVRFFPRSAQKLAVVPPGSGLDARLGPGEARARRQALGLPSRYALYVGTNKPHKNLPAMLAGWALAAREAPDTTRGGTLVVAGPADTRYPGAAAAAASNGIAGGVVDLGYVDDETLAAVYAGSSLFLFPSRSEGFGLPVVEAMAHGVPVICGPAAAVREVAAGAALAGDGTPEVIADAVVRLLRDPGERERLRAAGLSRASRFTWAAPARETASVYRRALDGT